MPAILGRAQNDDRIGRLRFIDERLLLNLMCDAYHCHRHHCRRSQECDRNGPFHETSVWFMIDVTGALETSSQFTV